MAGTLRPCSVCAVLLMTRMNQLAQSKITLHYFGVRVKFHVRLERKLWALGKRPSVIREF